MQEIKVKNNETNKAVYINELPSIYKFSEEAINTFIKSYEQIIFSMITKKVEKR